MATELDARFLLCPLPVLKARKALKALALGDVLTVLTTDAGAPQDFVHFCATTGNELVDSEPQDDHVRISIRRIV